MVMAPMAMAPAPMAPAPMALALSCLACGKSGGKLSGCGRCRKAWFCNRECQACARELGHRGAACRVDAVPAASSTALVDRGKLVRMSIALYEQAEKDYRGGMRADALEAVRKVTVVLSASDRIGGAMGAFLCAEASQLHIRCLVAMGDLAAAARVACSFLQACRASGNRTILVTTLSLCGKVAERAPLEMVHAERTCRAQLTPLLGGLDLSQEGVSLSTCPAGLAKLGLAYAEVAVAVCDVALAAAGGRGSPAAADEWRVPPGGAEARVRASLADRLDTVGEDRPRVVQLMRQAVALQREELRTSTSAARAYPEDGATTNRHTLAEYLSDLGMALKASSRGVEEEEACHREALGLCAGHWDAQLKGLVLRRLINLSGRVGATVGATEAEGFRGRLDQVLVHLGRSVEVDCSICLEPLAPPGHGAAGGDGQSSAGMRVLPCNHQFHASCLQVWFDTAPKFACPLCKV